MGEIHITIVVVLVVMIVWLLAMALAIRRFYIIVPAGTIGVRTGHGPEPRIVRTAGIFVIPIVHQLDLVHAEVESLDGKGHEILVQVDEGRGDVLKARTAFGQKPIDEVRRLLQQIVDAADGDEKAIDVKLAEVGYRRI